MSVASSEAPAATALPDLAALQRRLHGCTTVGQLFALAAAEGCRACMFTRGVVVSIQAGWLTAEATEAVSDPASDALRRTVLAAPIQLKAGTRETELIRQVEGARRARTSAASRLEEALKLRHHVLAVVAPESRALALVVLDRADRPIEPSDECRARLFAHLLGLAIERLVLRARLRELSAEVRHLTASANALAREALDAAITLPSDYGGGPVFPDVPIAAPTPDWLHDLLTDREAEVVTLMVEGRTNREIGERLALASETVKDHVGQIVSKLGASNRVDAVGRYVRMISK